MLLSLRTRQRPKFYEKAENREEREMTLSCVAYFQEPSSAIGSLFTN